MSLAKSLFRVGQAERTLECLKDMFDDVGVLLSAQASADVQTHLQKHFAPDMGPLALIQGSSKIKLAMQSNLSGRGQEGAGCNPI